MSGRHGNRPIRLLAMIKPGESAYYFHNDHLGTPQILTDGNGNVAWKAVYLPFGGTQILVESVENPFRFPGQYYDAETGLHYNYFRYYNPPIGRYITPDPIGLEGGINPFLYVQNNPVNWVDPWGLFIYAQESGQMLDVITAGALMCFEHCLGMEVTVTGAREIGLPHLPGSAHETGQACDLGRNNNPGLNDTDVERCFNECSGYWGGFVWGYAGEQNFHLQTVPGSGGARGFRPRPRR